MGTRLYYQNFVKDKFANLVRVRVWQDKTEPYQAVFYLEDRNGEFSELITNEVIPSLEEIREIGTKFKFKPYDQLEKDEIPPEPVLPDYIKTLAFDPRNNANAIKEKFQLAFPELGDFKIHAPLRPGVIGIEYNNKIDHKRLEEIKILGKELVSITAELEIFPAK